MERGGGVEEGGGLVGLPVEMGEQLVRIKRVVAISKTMALLNGDMSLAFATS